MLARKEFCHYQTNFFPRQCVFGKIAYSFLRTTTTGVKLVPRFRGQPVERKVSLRKHWRRLKVGTFKVFFDQKWSQQKHKNIVTLNVCLIFNLLVADGQTVTRKKWLKRRHDDAAQDAGVVEGVSDVETSKKHSTRPDLYPGICSCCSRTTSHHKSSGNGQWLRSYVLVFFKLGNPILFLFIFSLHIPIQVTNKQFGQLTLSHVWKV